MKRFLNTSHFSLVTKQLEACDSDRSQVTTTDGCDQVSSTQSPIGSLSSRPGHTGQPPPPPMPQSPHLPSTSRPCPGLIPVSTPTQNSETAVNGGNKGFINGSVQNNNQQLHMIPNGCNMITATSSVHHQQQTVYVTNNNNSSGLGSSNLSDEELTKLLNSSPGGKLVVLQASSSSSRPGDSTPPDLQDFKPDPGFSLVDLATLKAVADEDGGVTVSIADPDDVVVGADVGLTQLALVNGFGADVDDNGGDSMGCSVLRDVKREPEGDHQQQPSPDSSRREYSYLIILTLMKN